MNRHVEELIKSCDACQHYKVTGKSQHHQMPLVSSLRDKEPFKRVYVDCAESLTINVRSDITKKLTGYKVHIFTMVDVATNWRELALIPTENSCSSPKQFNLCWLCCHPCPKTVGLDNGNEFMEEEFQEMLTSHRIKSCPKACKEPNHIINRQTSPPQEK